MSENTTKTPTHNYLTMSKTEFSEKLEKQIKSGELLHAEEIHVFETYSGDFSIENQYEFIKFTDKFNVWNEYSETLLSEAFQGPNNKFQHEYEMLIHVATGYKLDTPLGLKRMLEMKVNYLKSLLARLDLLKEATQATSQVQSIPSQTVIQNNKVFIVHGHDSGVKNEIARFLSDLGLEPIILHEQASNGMTIIEKIERNTDVGFGIVLYTPCDLGATKDNAADLKPRARQNVVFEHGYLIGKIGRNRVCALTVNDVEAPGDINGVLYIDKDKSGAWKYQIVREMRSLGYNVDANKIK